MRYLLLSGGSGQRLWPLSNELRSKQFLPLFRGPGGEPESMLQRFWRRLRAADPDADIALAAPEAQLPAIRSQLGEAVRVCPEPCRRDTFPAIALAAAWLRETQGASEQEAVVVCPVDPDVDAGYFRALGAMGRRAETGPAPLVLMGIEPDGPSEQYGYILPEGKEAVSRVGRFQEKPDRQTAGDLLARGALWNGGVFASRLGYLLRCAHARLDFAGYEDLLAGYPALPALSFDRAVVEQEPEIEVIRYRGRWKDLGSWDTLTQALEGPAVGRAVLDGSCENVHVVNELDLPVLCVGLKDVVVAAGPDGILAADKTKAGGIKPLVSGLDRRARFAETAWGSFRVLDVQEGSRTLKLTLRAGRRMECHSHRRRDEVWTVLSGEGRAVVEGKEQRVAAGDVVAVAAGCRHALLAGTGMQLIEVQLGREIGDDDIQRWEGAE